MFPGKGRTVLTLLNRENITLVTVQRNRNDVSWLCSVYNGSYFKHNRRAFKLNYTTSAWQRDNVMWAVAGCCYGFAGGQLQHQGNIHSEVYF